MAVWYVLQFTEFNFKTLNQIHEWLNLTKFLFLLFFFFWLSFWWNLQAKTTMLNRRTQLLHNKHVLPLPCILFYQSSIYRNFLVGVWNEKPGSVKSLLYFKQREISLQVLQMQTTSYVIKWFTISFHGVLDCIFQLGRGKIV